MESGSTQHKTIFVSLAEWADLLDPEDAAKLVDPEGSLFGSDLDSDGEDAAEVTSNLKKKASDLSQASTPGIKQKPKATSAPNTSGTATKPQGKKRQRAKKRSPASKARNDFKKASRFVKIAMANAKEHTVKLEHICIHELLKQPVTKNDAIPDTWLEIPEPTGPNAVSTLVVDKNDIPLMVHLPKFLPDKSHEIVYDALIEFGNTVEKYLTLGGGADSSGRNTKSAYRIKPGEISGVINVSLWHAIGHTTTEAIFSRDQLRTSANYSSCAKVVFQLRQISHKLNETLRFLDPDAYVAHRTLRQKLKVTYPHVRARSAIDPFLFQGRSFIYNRQTPNHFDRSEPLIGWTPLFVVGQFTGGSLRVRKLGVRMWFGPGACIWLRGGLLPHEVEPFDGGQRISVASFLHRSVWDIVDVEPRSTGVNYRCPEATTDTPASIPPRKKEKTAKGSSTVKAAVVEENGLRRSRRVIIPTKFYEG